MSEILWGKNAKVSYLLIAAVAMLFAGLGGREIWTQEHRWADIVSAMIYYRDFLHPVLNGVDYYDKPLLSYWLIIAVAKITGTLSAWTLRIPSAFAGLLAVWSIYRLGTNLKDKRLGLLAGWMLITSFYVIFWARTSSADMLNMAGTLFAVQWYFSKKIQTRFFDYVIFFLILAVTALCKGLVGPVVAALVIFPDLCMQQEWKKHLNIRILFAMIPAMIVYIIPFWLSSHFSNASYGENGLYLVYRENILRFFQPFDHKGPIYTYFEFLPIYLFPWTLLFIPALLSLKNRWKTLSNQSKWMVWSSLLLFLFLTLSGSRRNYYVLPLVPFVILFTADWILSGADNLKRNIWSARLAVIAFAICFIQFAIVQPFYYAQGGMVRFAADVKQQVQPSSAWQFVMLDPESKVRFYLQLPPEVKNFNQFGSRNKVSRETILQIWPVLNRANNKTIFISRKMYEPLLKEILKNYHVVDGKSGLGERLFVKDNPNLPIAFIPN